MSIWKKGLVDISWIAGSVTNEIHNQSKFSRFTFVVGQCVDQAEAQQGEVIVFAAVKRW